MRRFGGETSRWTMCEAISVVVGDLVRVAEAAAGLDADVDRFLHREATALLAEPLDDRLEVRPVDELHDDEVGVVRRADVEDGDDVRVVEAGAEAGLVEEHRDEVRVLREVRQDALDRDLLLEALDALGFALEHLRHAAGLEAVHDAVSLLGHGSGAVLRGRTRCAHSRGLGLWWGTQKASSIGRSWTCRSRRRRAP